MEKGGADLFKLAFLMRWRKKLLCKLRQRSTKILF
jgi:hypothetical protein